MNHSTNLWLASRVADACRQLLFNIDVKLKEDGFKADEDGFVVISHPLSADRLKTMMLLNQASMVANEAGRLGDEYVKIGLDRADLWLLRDYL